jgi:hypothetical protein
MHTAVAGVVALTAFVGSGLLVTDADGVRPTLEALSLHTPAPAAPAPGYPLSTDDLVDAGQVGSALGGAWTTEMTSDSTDGTGLVLPCRQQQYADGAPRAALMRTLVSGDRLSVGQSAEVATNPTAAHAAYAATLKWYGGCREPRLQLMSTRRVTGVGDEATVVELRDWNNPTRSVVAGVARTGVLTTTVVSAEPAGSKDPVRKNTGLLAEAVGRLCQLPEAGTCSTTPKTHTIAPIPTGEHPAMLSEVDLPPVAGVMQPWTATAPKAATTNLAATRCDQSVFHRKGVTGDLTRSYVIPAAKLPPQFGLAETIGSFGTKKAASKLVEATKTALAGCPKKDLGTKVSLVEDTRTPARELSVWRVRVEISKKSSVDFLMALVRDGDNVAQVGFVPSGSATISDDAFVALTHRAADRLHQLG